MWWCVGRGVGGECGAEVGYGGAGGRRVWRARAGGPSEPARNERSGPDRARCRGQAPGAVDGLAGGAGGRAAPFGCRPGRKRCGAGGVSSGCIGEGRRGNGCGRCGSGVRFGGQRASERDWPGRMREVNQSLSARGGRSRTRRAESSAGHGKRASEHAVGEGVLRWRVAGSGRERDGEGGAYDAVYRARQVWGRDQVWAGRWPASVAGRGRCERLAKGGCTGWA